MLQNKKVIHKVLSKMHVNCLQCPFSRPYVHVLYCFIFSRDKTELNELICEEWLQTLLHHAGLISQEAALTSTDKSHVNYEGNGVLYSYLPTYSMEQSPS